MLNNHEQQILNRIEKNLLGAEIVEELYGTISLKLENHLRKNNFSITNKMPKAKIRRILKFKYKDLITFLKDLSAKENLRETGSVLKEKVWETTDSGNDLLKTLENLIKNTDESWIKTELQWIAESTREYLVYEMGEGAFSNVISAMYVLAVSLEKEEI